MAGDDPLHTWALERTRRIAVEGLQISVAPIEYAIVRKLSYYRECGSDMPDGSVRVRATEYLTTTTPRSSTCIGYAW